MDFEVVFESPPLCLGDDVPVEAGVFVALYLPSVPALDYTVDDVLYFGHGFLGGLEVGWCHVDAGL